MISGIIIAHTTKMYLKARLSAPVGVCIALRIWAVASTIAPLASSDGWNWTMPRSIQRCEPFVLSPMHSTMTSRMNENSRANGVTILK